MWIKGWLDLIGLEQLIFARFKCIMLSLSDNQNCRCPLAIILDLLYYYLLLISSTVFTVDRKKCIFFIRVILKMHDLCPCKALHFNLFYAAVITICN